ncbi:MAG: membrane protein insertase YidC [Myxococcota bacterium]
MEESRLNQRLLLAAVLSLAAMLGWRYLFPPPPAPKKPVIAQHAEGTQTATVAGLQPIDSVKTATVVARRPDVKPETIEVHGSVVGGENSDGVPYNLTLSNVGGVIDGFMLTSFRERDTSNQATDQGVTLADPIGARENAQDAMGGIEFGAGSTFSLPDRPTYEVVEHTQNFVKYRYLTDSGVEIEREYSIRPDSFEVEMAVTVRNKSAEVQRHKLQMNTSLILQPAMKSGGFMMMSAPDHLNAMCLADGKVRRETHEAVRKEPKTYKGGVKWAAMDRQYFTSAIIARDGDEAECQMFARGERRFASLVLPEVTLRPGEERRHKFTAYLGVKQPALLSRVDAQLESAIDYTVLGLNLSLLCQGLLLILGLFHKLLGSWGLAILGLTVLVKGVLFPLNQRSGRSMRAISALKPELDKLKEKYPDDRQRQTEETMRLYREHGANPASGCLPMLLQMPIWFALYRALWVSVDLYQERFLWLPDLTARDPYWVLPIVLVGVMFIQQKMTPSTMDPAQQKVMLWVMPLLFGTMMMALPAGLAFYILVNSLLTIVQQHFINKTVGPVEGSPSAREAAA